MAPGLAAGVTRGCSEQVRGRRLHAGVRNTWSLHRHRPR